MSFLNSFFGRILIIISLVFVAYSWMLHAPFKTMDDRFSIVQNPLIRSSQNIPEIFKQGYFKDKSYYRPLVNLSFMGEYHAFGLNSFYYNLDNLLIHALNAVLVFFLIGLLSSSQRLGFWTALIFAIHPVHWEAVCNIPGRAILMTTTFELSAFLFFLLCVLRKNWGWMALSMVFFALALLCKESAGVLPVVFAGFLWTKTQTKLREKIFYLVPFFLVIASYLLLRHFLHITKVFQTTDMGVYLLGFLTFMHSMITHVRTLFLPIDLHFDRGTEFFTSFNDPQLAFTVFFWIGVGVALYQWRIHFDRFILFLFFWFAMAMLPVSQLVASIGIQPGVISSADHFLYVASIPFILTFLIYLEKVWDLNIQRRWVSLRVLKFAFGGVCVFFLLTAIEQSFYAREELAMLKRSISYQPNNARVQASLGLQYVFREDLAHAEEHFANAVHSEAMNARYRISLGTSLCQQGKWMECLGEYVALDLTEKDLELERLKKKTLEHILSDIQAGKDYDAKGWFILGVYYAKVGSVDEAIKYFEQAVAKNPEMTGALMNLGSLYESQKNSVKAQEYYARILSSSRATPTEKAFAQQHMNEIKGKG